MLALLVLSLPLELRVVWFIAMSRMLRSGLGKDRRWAVMLSFWGMRGGGAGVLIEMPVKRMIRDRFGEVYSTVESLATAVIVLSAVHVKSCLRSPIPRDGWLTETGTLWMNCHKR